MSHRIGLRFIAKLLAKVLLFLSENPYIPYRLRIYIIRNRWVCSVLYHARLRDRLTYQPLSVVTRELDEAASAADSYSVETADRVERSLEESSTVTDGYSAVEADRVERPLEESSTVDDSYSVETADRVERRLEETVRASDGYNIATSERLTIRLEETVRPRETGIEGAPWEEDPDKKLWAYYDFEKALVDETANFFILNPSLIKTLDATDVEETAATLNGYLYGDGWVERGFEWGTTPGHYTEEWTETGSFSEGAFSHTITGLDPNNTYYFRAKARKGG